MTIDEWGRLLEAAPRMQSRDTPYVRRNLIHRGQRA
jgi:hypothetical protein